ncbi:uncharacterized protein BDZ99DRAFT_305394 [Mytilinidion resinicola]|uniref:SnoaL-like domain-containing protein n=1 Tax=Mytilinidion resinicola TaxID=574789 RepID=A0A6A6YQH7_9PEZI|nr:uncharacterized protein BDZ99DRAFT_305394 [Mytilinidion resinicola]KAF2810137.1 hypothetical protein BDZ99DRAFT_305394 [Mytilinidion resinicola]
MAQRLVNPLDYFAIQNVISRYCVALDSKEFERLAEVFTTDVDATYPFPGGDLKGIEALESKIRARLGKVVTQHALTTQIITFNDDGKSASAETYFTGSHFGHGAFEGQVITAYGKYMDQLVCCEGAAPGMPGASGLWLIKKREVRFMKRIGDEGIMQK